MISKTSCHDYLTAKIRVLKQIDLLSHPCMAEHNLQCPIFKTTSGNGESYEFELSKISFYSRRPLFNREQMKKRAIIFIRQSFLTVHESGYSYSGTRTSRTFLSRNFLSVRSADCWTNETTANKNVVLRMTACDNNFYSVHVWIDKKNLFFLNLPLPLRSTWITRILR